MIAAVNGHAIGLGLTLALQCDIRFFAADAQYGVVQVRRGMVGDAYSHWVLPRLVGLSNAAEILLERSHFRRPPGGGARAWAAGCSTPTTCCRPRCELAHDIAENTAPASVAASKRLLWDSFDLDRAAVGARETEIHLALMRHDDAKEGVRAFLERRPPGGPADSRQAAEPTTSTPAARMSSTALALDSGATPAVRSSRTRVAKPARPRRWRWPRTQ